MYAPWRVLILAAVLITPQVVAAQAPSTPAAVLTIPNATEPYPGILSSGQPTAEQFEAAARAGYRTVINLRSLSESGFEWEAGLAERLGLRYVSIPVSGPSTLTREAVAAFDAALRDARASGPVWVHCNSGNRNGAMFALRAAWIEGMDPEAAIAVGRSAGLTRLEGDVRQMLGVP